jgi:hypothetical protein
MKGLCNGYLPLSIVLDITTTPVDTFRALLDRGLTDRHMRIMPRRLFEWILRCFDKGYAP